VLNYRTFYVNELYLNGPAAQHISFGENHPFGGTNLNRTVSTEPIILLDDFYASNCTVHWGNSPLQFSPAASKIVTQNVVMRNASVASTLSHEMHMSESCRIHTLSFASITNMGFMTLLTDIPVSGELVNHGTIRNWGGYQVLIVDGTLTNFGTITNSGFYLTVHAKGDVVNRGVWTITMLHINGIQDQSFLIGGNLEIQYIRLYSEIGTAQWWHNGVYSGTNGAYISLSSTAPNLYGTWQPYEPGQNLWGRLINIIDGTPDVPGVLTINYAGGFIILEWDEVPDAAAYKIYASDNPGQGFVVIVPAVIDPNPGSGRVQYSLVPDADRRFFQVTAIDRPISYEINTQHGSTRTRLCRATELGCDRAA